LRQLPIKHEIQRPTVDEDQRGYAVTLGLTSNPNDVHQDKAFTLLEDTMFYVKPYSSHIPEE